MYDIMNTVDQWLQQGKHVALATVVATWGSSPRQTGAKMAIADDMSMVGSVSGGCVETAVVQEALDSLEDRQPRLLHYGISDDTAWTVGLACGGKISVYVEPLDQGWWQQATQAARNNHASITATVIESEAAGRKVFFNLSQIGSSFASPSLTSEQQHALSDAAMQGMDRRKSGRAIAKVSDAEELPVMIDVHKQHPRLIIIGGAHISVALNQMARLLGFRVVVIDPRQVFATAERFPDLDAMLHTYPDKALAELGIDEETYIAVLTHDPKIDDPALVTALPSSAPYIGVLSSARSHEQRLIRLKELGVTDDLLARIHTPIGLEIGARSPEEIALSVMAEIVAARNGVLNGNGNGHRASNGAKAQN
ncbi:MAG: XdhC family protein [Anaerolineae bacterium]|nr:XdhC family protein [Anaerolineae bacterium]